MTHNQVSYWDSRWRNENQQRSNEIAQQQANIHAFEAARDEYWTHKNYNWNESMFGFTLFKTFSSMIGMAMFG